MKISKPPSLSKVVKTEVVCPNDTNPMGILQGGRLVQWMDIAAAVCAQTHSGKICVTASINTVSFMRPVHTGDVLIIKALITRAFTSSMEILVRAWSKNVHHPKNQLVSESYFTFVAVDENGKASSVIPVRPVTSSDRKLYEAASKRKRKK